MKTFSKIIGSPETESQQITGYEFTDNSPEEKVSGYFSKEHQNIEMSPNEIFHFKKKLTLLITLAIALAAFLMTACEDDPKPCNTCSVSYPAPGPRPTPDPVAQIAIRSMHPTDGAPGSTVTIILENFTDSNVDNHVSFGSSYAEIIHARYGMINVRVPMDLPYGDYKVTVRSHGQMASAPGEFKVIKAAN